MGASRRAKGGFFDTGAFAGSGPGVASVATLVLAGPYRIPNLLVEGYAVYTNKTNCGSYRAPSGPQANFAVESQMDVIADALGLDPLDLRLRNIVREGDEGPTGQVLAAVSLEECLVRAAEAIGWRDRRPAPGRGKGLACGWWTTTGGSSGVYVKINADGTVALNTGAAEIGTAALTGAAQVLAEELGVDLDDVSVVSADTFSTPFDLGAQGSRTAFAVGNACRAAAAELRRTDPRAGGGAARRRGGRARAARQARRRRRMLCIAGGPGATVAGGRRRAHRPWDLHRADNAVRHQARERSRLPGVPLAELSRARGRPVGGRGHR